MRFDNFFEYNNRDRSIFSAGVLMSVYLIVRIIFGLHSSLVYGFVGLLILFRFSFEKIALIFLALSMLTFIMGKDIEANHHLSFVYGFMFLALLKYVYFIIRERF